MKIFKNTLILTLGLIFTLSAISFSAPRRKNFNDCPERRPGNFKGEHFRGRGPHQGGRFFFGNMERMKSELELTDKQVTAISDINLAYKKKHLDLKEKLAPKRIKLQKLLIEEKVNLSAVKSSLKEISEIQTEKRFLMIKHHIDIEKVLTNKQRQKLRSRRPGHGPFSFRPGMERGMHHPWY